MEISSVQLSGLSNIPDIKTQPEYAFDALANEVRRFENTLPATLEIGIAVAGADNIIHVSSIRRSGQMIIFEGLDNHGRIARLIQHYTQVSLQIIAVDKLKDEANRIGF